MRPLVEPIATPNPAEFALRVWVDAAKIIPAHLPTPEVTKYKDFKMHPTPNRAEGYGDYIYTYAGETVTLEERGPDGKPVTVVRVPFYFAKSKTDEEKWTPYRSTPRFQDFPWEDIVYAVRPVPDYTAVRAGTTLMNGTAGTYVGPSWNVEIDRVAGGMIGTRIIRHEFVSPTKFEPPRYPAPVPLPMHVILPNGESLDIPASLHERIEIPPLASALQTAVDGVSYGTAGVVPEQVFDETNATTWRRRRIEFSQRQENGVWHAIMEVAVNPPVPEPRTSTR